MINTNEIVDIEFSDIDHKDHPDYCDAFIQSAMVWEEGTYRPLTEDELEYIMENEQDWVYEKLMDYIF